MYNLQSAVPNHEILDAQHLGFYKNVQYELNITFLHTYT